ncbi:MAG: idi [Deltaproteobacteria bacterium]|nr:idi [Deltaproteobacteria bacterium]
MEGWVNKGYSEGMKHAELIVLVNFDGDPIGTAEKLASHHGSTPLHLGFSCFVFNRRGELLITQRALVKKVWPGVWTNSVCGHPGPNEPVEAAIRRRLDHELGMGASDLQCALPDYRYQTPPFRGIVENEICPVYLGRTSDEPSPNREEVAAYQWMSWKGFLAAVKNDRGRYSYWCIDEAMLLSRYLLLQEYSEPARSYQEAPPTFRNDENEPK